MKVRMQRRLAGIALASLLLFTTTACGGPKLSEEGPWFQQNAQAMLDELADGSAAEGSTPTVKQDATTDVSCGDGKAKRAFEASMPLKLSAELDTTFDFAVTAVSAAEDGYTIKTFPHSDDLVRREMTLRADEHPATMTAVLTAKPVPTLTLTGETDCLNAG
jgi:hypothetical protein